MITANLHEPRTRLSRLVKAVEEDNETMVLCRHGRAVVEIRRLGQPRRRVRTLVSDPRFHVEFAAGYEPTEPLSGAEWPEDPR